MKIRQSSPSLVSYVALAALTLGLGACGGDASEPVFQDPPAPGETPTAAAPAADAAGGTLIAAGIALDMPADWQQQPSESNMRLAQAAIPGSGGDGLLTVFFFGVGGGGTAQMNLDRWAGQIAAEAGAEASTSVEQAGDYTIHFVEHRGTLKASSISFPETDQPGYALLGAVIEGPGGPWFLKSVAPEATMAEQADAFRAMVRSVRPADA